MMKQDVSLGIGHRLFPQCQRMTVDIDGVHDQGATLGRGSLRATDNKQCGEGCDSTLEEIGHHVSHVINASGLTGLELRSEYRGAG